MYIFNLAQRLIYNKPLLHIILIIQFVASFFVIECAVSTLTLTTSSSSFMKPLLQSDFCYFSVAERNVFIDENGNLLFNNSDIYFEDCLEGLDVAMQNDMVSLNVGSKASSLQLQPEKLIQKTSPDMYSGELFNSENSEENVIRIITNDKSFQTGSYHDVVLTDFNGKEINAKIKIVGVLVDPAYVLSATTAGSEMSSANISHIMDKAEDGAFSSIGCTEDYEALIGEKIKHPINKNALLLFNNSITTEEMQNNIDFLRERGVVATSEDILKTTKSDNMYIIKTYLPTFIFLFFVSLSGIFAVSTINISSQIKTLSLYGMLGCSDKDIKKIIYCYISVICAIPLLIIWIILLLSKYLNTFSGYFLTISAFNYLLPVFICALVCLVVPIVPIYTFRKQSLIALQRKN